MKPGANESLRPPLYATLGFIAQLQKMRSALQKDDFVEKKTGLSLEDPVFWYFSTKSSFWTKVTTTQPYKSES